MRKITTLFALLLMAVIGASAANVAKVKIGTTETEYDTFEAAWKAITEVATVKSGTIYLLDNATADNTLVIPSGKNISIYLDGKKLTLKGSDGILFKENDCEKSYLYFYATTGKTGTVDATACTNASINIKKGTSKNTLYIGKSIIIDGQSVVIQGNSNTLTCYGTVKTYGPNDDAIMTNGANTTNATINLYSTAEIIAEQAIGMYLPGEATVTISDGAKVTGTTGVYIKSGTLTVKGGTITGTGAAAAYSYNSNGGNATGEALVIDNCNYPSGAPTVTIKGGTFKSQQATNAIGSYASQGETAVENFVYSGSFSSILPAEYCAEGYTPSTTADANGNYGVNLTSECKIENEPYSYFGNAANDVTGNRPGYEGKVITLLGNISDPYTLAFGKTLKVETNGFTVTVTAAAGYVAKSSTADGITTYTVVEAGVKLTSKNGTVSYLETLGTSFSSDGTYQLLKDCNVSSYVAEGIFASDVTLDLNGHTLTTGGDYGIFLGRDGTSTSPRVFNLISTNGEGTLSLANNNKAAIQIQGKYNNVTIGSNVVIDAGCVAVLGANQTLNVEGTINGGNDFAIATNGSKTTNATINIKDGAVLTSNVTALYLPGTGTTTIEDGSTITGATGVYVKSGTLNITGGTINGTGADAGYTYNGNGANATGDALVVDNCGYPGGAPTVNVTDGTFTSANAAPVASYAYTTSGSATTNEPVTSFVTGGIFDEPIPVELCGTNLIPIEYDVVSGTYTVAQGVIITDGQSYTVEGNKPALYKRHFSAKVANTYQCWFVPFAYIYTQKDKDSGVEFYRFKASDEQSVGADNVIEIVKVVNVGDFVTTDPWLPAIIKVPAEGDFEFTSHESCRSLPDNQFIEGGLVNYDLTISGNTTFGIYGTIEQVTATAENEWATLNTDGQLFWSKVGSNVKPYRWVLKDKSGNGARDIKFVVVGEENTIDTGISTVNTTASSDNEIVAIYSANGQRLQSMQKGINIIRMKDNTVKKVIIK